MILLQELGSVHYLSLPHRKIGEGVFENFQDPLFQIKIFDDPPFFG